jgi:prepilin-type N-terminal cleavage/methylation domain-containing protein
MRSQNSRRGFTLIELLVVIAIIALVIAIVLPTLGGVRDAARGTGTKQILNEVNQAISQFDNDNRRMPGYFDERDMAHADNETRGMSSMENVMLELMGAEIATGNSAPGGGATWVQVGPMNTNRVWVNLDTLGSGSGGARAYYTPAAKNYVAQSPPGQVGVLGHAGPEGTPQLADLIDMWGQPILAWRLDPVTQVRITQPSHFADISAPTGNAPGARFYWTPNAAFLNSPALGRRGVNQTDGDRGSLLSGSVSDANLRDSMAAFLGHPSYPIQSNNPNDPNSAPQFPAQGRGQIILHSAGSDGVYFGRKDNGAKQFQDGNPMRYRQSFATFSTPAQWHVDKDGKRTVIDLVDRFDDMISAAGN